MANYQQNPASLLVLLYTITSLISFLTSAQTEFCSNGGVFAENSSFHDNLSPILASLPSNTTSNGGFYSATLGSGADKLFLLSQCRGDVGPDDCRSCLNSSAAAARSKCRNQNEAVIYGDVCLLRYSGQDFFGKAAVEPSLKVH